ncbi:hypothetical protein AAC387_Pa01g1577 [Persea americana]
MHELKTRFTAGAYAVSNSFGSPSPLSESWESSSKQPPSFMHRSFSSRRSFMSKPVYPLVYQNPVSDSEACGSVDETNCIMLATNNKRSPMWSESPSSLDLKFHNTLTELQKMEASPDPSMSSRREGFRWSNASSNDMGFDGQSIDMTERLYLENVRLPYNPTDDQKCGLCGRLLVQKSPWSSYRIVRSGDMPIAGVLPCSHVFHAACLEQKTPKTQVYDPPCPVCQKIANGVEASSPVLEPLQMALRAVRMNQGVDVEANGEGNDDQLLYQMESRMTRNQSLSIPRQGGNSSIKNHFKKHFSFKGKMGKDLFGAKLFLRAGSSSSNPHDNQNPVGCL